MTIFPFETFGGNGKKFLYVLREKRDPIRYLLISPNIII